MEHKFGTIPTEGHSVEFSDAYRILRVQFGGTFTMPGQFPVAGSAAELLIEIARGKETEYVDPTFGRTVLDTFPGGNAVVVSQKLHVLLAQLQASVEAGVITQEQQMVLMGKIKKAYDAAVDAAESLVTLLVEVEAIKILPVYREVVKK